MPKGADDANPQASQAIGKMEKTSKSHYLFRSDTTCVRSAVISKKEIRGIATMLVFFFSFFFGGVFFLGWLFFVPPDSPIVKS